jgi:large subunit ribosomal protein L17
VRPAGPTLPPLSSSLRTLQQILSPQQRHETWRRLSQVLKDVVASDVNATVKSLGVSCRAEHRLTRKTSNLVSSLIQHEQIKTTLPKARDTARLAEKVAHPSYILRQSFSEPHRCQIITLGKKGTHPAFKKAAGFLLQPSLTPKVFETLAARYAKRPGGYTRIHKFGNRQGDNAPHAVLELVDGPRDLKFEMAARATGWDVLSGRLKDQSARALVKHGVGEVGDTVVR